MGKKDIDLHMERKLFHETMLGVLEKSKHNFARNEADTYENDYMNDLWFVWYEARNYTKWEIEEKAKELKND